MTPGQVGKVRELNRGVEAEVCVGATGKYGYAVLKIVGVSPAVRAALDNLRAALRQEAHDSLVAAQKAVLISGHDAIGVGDEFQEGDRG